jgi:hypothetical protein
MAFARMAFARMAFAPRPRNKLLTRVAVIAAAAAVGTLGAACGSGRSSAPPGEDGGADIDVAPAHDGTIEATTRPPSCLAAATICVGTGVHACVSDKAGDLAEDCAEACSFGRCTTRACADAEQTDALHGCRFYAVQVDNVDVDDDANLMLILTSASTEAADVDVDVRSAAGAWDKSTSLVVPAGGGARLELNRPARQPGLTKGGAYRITSDAPISVVEVVSDDASHGSSSSGGTVLLPMHALGTSYLAMAFPQLASAEVAAVAGSRDGAGTIVIVGTVDHSTVRVRPTVPIVLAPGAPPSPDGTFYDFTVDEGDVVQLFSALSGGDLSGSELVSDHPIEVLSGNTFTSYGRMTTGLNGADLAIEQLPSTEGWSKEYVGAWLKPQAGCDPYFREGGGSWQVIASHDGTSVTLLPAPGTMFDLAGTTFRLDRGASKRFFTFPDPATTATGGSTPAGDFVVHADQPILLGQWLDCEPGLSLGIDTRFGAKDTVFVLPPGFDHQVVIVRRAGKAVTFDDQPVSDDAFRPASPSGDYEVARFSGDELGPCVELLDGCRHHVVGETVAVSWRGMDIVCSYAVTLPTGNMCALPGVSCPL